MLILILAILMTAHIQILHSFYLALLISRLEIMLQGTQNGCIFLMNYHKMLYNSYFSCNAEVMQCGYFDQKRSPLEKILCKSRKIMY